LFTEPKLEHREAVHAAVIATQTPWQEFGTVIPQSLDAVADWLKTQGLSPAGAPFLRLLVIDMERLLNVEIGFPVEKALAGEGKIKSVVIPEGMYATLIYTGVENGIAGNAALLGWGEKQKIVWKTSQTPNGDELWAGRLEYFLTDPDDEPDRGKWQTEVAILTEN
jgi:effector-binding domain-containing protein